MMLEFIIHLMIIKALNIIVIYRFSNHNTTLSCIETHGVALVRAFQLSFINLISTTLAPYSLIAYSVACRQKEFHWNAWGLFNEAQMAILKVSMSVILATMQQDHRVRIPLHIRFYLSVLDYCSRIVYRRHRTLYARLHQLQNSQSLAII